ncbi:KICSTOR complex protein ITFG2-like [Metopolophium dirhodum]|uniref:KICSTOR complex protein ITFG2-like n=1 Tax=Metopolophium dirhodum TaxID=44670 RepID=UPI0029905427|nr:KICSTOR complex protein ITFG2-like [Metopolophium dirhodum]
MDDNEINIATFVDFFDFELPGNVLNSAIALGDVDNDNEIELVIGSVEGDLFIFKGHQLIQKISALGIITAIAIGDLMHCGSNAVIVITGDGWCHIYLCLKCSELDPSDECIMKLEPVHHQRIPANTKVILLGDMDSDGMLELIIGSTDKVVHSFRWIQNVAAGRLVPLHKWGCANQIGSIILIKDDKNQPCLLVSQPGITAMRFYCPITFPEFIENKIKYENENELPIELFNASISSVMIGDLKVDIECDQELFDKNDHLYGIASLDGLVMLAKKETILWSKNIDQELFIISKLSIADDGPDYLITCSLNGDTIIVDQKSQHSTFKFGESVSAFCCGMYTVKPNTKSMPSFVFITNSQKVYVYYGLKLPSTCVQSLSKCIENDNHLSTFMEKYEGPLKKKMIRDCLYKYNSNKM